MFADYPSLQLGIRLNMRFVHAAAAIGIAIAALFIAQAMLTETSAHADLSGYRRCVGKVTEPVAGRDPQNLQLVGTVEQDLNSGASPAAEAQKVARMGFDPPLANAIVQCVIEEHP
ncbi:hypothetical protein A5688_21660 [Mycobacterium mantenii]|nr:hypothetical protein A5688_21660 [Mycobacterium mantenii]